MGQGAGGTGAAPQGGFDVMRQKLAALLARVGIGGNGNGGGAEVMKPTGPAVARPTMPRGGVGAIEDREYESWNGTDKEKKLAGYILQCFKLAADARRIQEGRYITNYAYYRDRQYEYWDDQQSALMHWRSRDPNPHRSWDVHNKLKPKLRSLVARTHGANLETLITAMSEAQADRDYAAAQRAVQDHVAAKNKTDKQNLELVRWSTITGPMFRKTWVDWDGEILRPLFAEDGQSVADVVEERSGEIRKGIFGWQEAYPDPRADSPDRWAWFIHAQELTIDEIIEQFPDRGHMVKPAPSGRGQFDDTRRRLDVVNNNWQRGRQGYDTALVKEFWCKPCATWPEGVTAWECEGVILWSGPWLYPSLKELPFVPYVYETAYQTPWADAATDSARGAQDHYNEALNAIVDAAKEGPKLLTPTGAGIKPDSFRRGKPREVIPYDPTLTNPQAIQYLNAPAVPQHTYEMLSVADKDISDILGVDPISEGRVPAGIEAAAAIQSLEEFNRASSVITIETYRDSLLQDALITEQLARGLYRGKALLTSRASSGEAQSGDAGNDIGAMTELLAALGANSDEYAQAIASLPQEQKEQAASRVVDLDALQRGRANIDIRATTPKTGPQRQQELMQMAQAGMFDPERLDVTIPMLELMQVEDYDKLRAQLLRVLIGRQAKAKQELEAAQQAQADIAEAEQAKTDATMQGKQMEVEARLQESEARNAATIEVAKINASTQLQIALINSRKGTGAPMGTEGEEVDDMPLMASPMPYEKGDDLPEPFSEESFAAIQQTLHEGAETPQFEQFEHSPAMAQIDPTYAAQEAAEGMEPQEMGEQLALPDMDEYSPGMG